jgi:hypothetical protein
MRIETPQYTAEFGHELTLHDAEILSIHLARKGSKVEMTWRLAICQRPTGLPAERHYEYSLHFSDVRGSVDALQFIGEGSPEAYIYDFEIEPRTFDDLAVKVVVLPKGMTHEFRCNAIAEEELRKCGHRP